MTLWHYTTAMKWPHIRHDGRINCARALFPNERPAAWFSSRGDYEPTARKRALNPATGAMLLLTVDQTELYAGGLVRIGIDPAAGLVQVVDWHGYRAQAGVPRDGLRHMVARGREMGGTPSEWFASFAPVPASAWTVVEARDPRTKRWSPIGG